jgi:hypothetical protein
MNRKAFLLALAVAFLLSACSDGSSLPSATGKANISAINAIYGSPSLRFMIEERGLGEIPYKGISGVESYDDLDYIFNFEVTYAGEFQPTRIASQFVDFVADQHYTILATGTVTDPTLTLWEMPVREFDATETVFQARFAHSSNLLSDTAIDIYFALEGVAPAAGEQVATLNFGEVSESADFETDEYVVIITSSGNPGDILFTSNPTFLVALTDFVITPFDGDENDLGPLVVRGLGALGAIRFNDALKLPTIQFLHAAMEMDTTDVYDDELLSSQILANHAYRDLTARTPIDLGDYEFFYTPAGDTTMVSLQAGFSTLGYLNFRQIAVGTGGAYGVANLAQNRRSVSTGARLLYFQSSNNFAATDLYLVEAGTSIDDTIAFRRGLPSQAVIPTFEVAPGSYDVYITEFLETEILAGPYPLDMALGDVFDMVVFDTVDPVVLDIVVYPNPP